ncbi:MAG: ketopantoate reductase family protein [Chloroflexota bacterium]
MKIVILGAGAIGSVVGGFLARAGNDVILIGRPGHVNAINKNGLKLTTPTGTHIIKLPAVTDCNQVKFESDDVVFLCVKGQNTEEALPSLKAVIKDVPVFCFQNGVRNEEMVAKYFSKVYGVMIRMGAVYLNDGEVMVRRDPPGWLVMGRYPKGTDELIENVANTLSKSEFSVLVTPDVMPYKWGKLMTNLANAVDAITDSRGEDIRFITNAVRQELADLLTQAGISWKTSEQIAKDWPEINAPARASMDTAEKSSTWQSLARQQGTVETEFLNGEVVRLAEKLGKQAPVNEGLIRVSQEMAAKREKPGRYSPKELGKLLGLSPG